MPVDSPFPVLGLPDWPGGRGPRLASGTGRRQHSVVHSYHREPGRRGTPVIVISQTAAPPGPGDYLPHQLLDRADRPAYVEPVGRRTYGAVVEDEPVTAAGRRWADPRLADARFRRRGFHLWIASWEHPLDGAFFAALGVLRP